MERRILVAYWLLLGAITAIATLAQNASTIATHPAGWRAAAGPLLVIIASIVSAVILLQNRLPRRTGWLLAGLVAIAQAASISIDQLAYRLVAGPFLALTMAPHIALRAGSDAHLLLIIGNGNRVPDGLAINIIALSLLVVVITGAQRDVSQHVPAATRPI